MRAPCSLASGWPVAESSPQSLGPGSVMHPPCRAVCVCVCVIRCVRVQCHFLCVTQLCQCVYVCVCVGVQVSVTQATLQPLGAAGPVRG